MTFKASGLPGVVPAVPGGIATAETWGDVEELARHVRTLGANAVHHTTSNESTHGIQRISNGNAIEERNSSLSTCLITCVNLITTFEIATKLLET